jgi:hypothetical protein
MAFAQVLLTVLNVQRTYSLIIAIFLLTIRFLHSYFKLLLMLKQLVTRSAAADDS